MKSAVMSRLSAAPVSHALPFDGRDLALLDIGRVLRDSQYQFTTVTPETHRRVLKRKLSPAYTELRDIFGWNRPFRMKSLAEPLRDLIAAAQIAKQIGAVAKSTVRYATAGSGLYLHSGYPTVEGDAVFFGPDTYRFLQFITDEVRSRPAPRTIADIGTGSGAGAIQLSLLFPRARVIATDINETALRFTALNGSLNGAPMIEVRASDIAANLPKDLDLIVANPPYLVDAAARRYRHGGGATGSDLSLRIIREATRHLSRDGQLLLYTGTAIVEGRDPFRDDAEAVLADTPWRIHAYREIDPDVFGEELDNPVYNGVDRIAVVGVTARAR